MTEFTLLYSTFPDADSAREAARILVANHAVACVNLIPDLTSIYECEGAMQEENEVLFLAKTTTESAPQAIYSLRQQHPYDTPCITLIPISGGDENYLEWIKNAVFTKKSG